MLGEKSGRKLNAYVPDYVVFDLETTGISCESDRVVEISGIKVQQGTPVEEFSMLVNPQMPIPAAASNVNGITDDMVADCVTFDVALKAFLEFAGDHVLVGHNIHRFDMRFIIRDAQEYWGQTITNDYIDTLDLARAYLPGHDQYSLTYLAGYFGIDTDEAHRALADCRMNQKVFEFLHKEMENPSEEVRAMKVCPKCGNFLKKRSGRYGDFWGCTGYPECRYTENIP